MITIPVAVSNPQPTSAGERALMKWYPLCNERIARAIRVARPHWPLIVCDRGRGPRAEVMAGRGGHAA